ncbi:MAG: ComF family protein [Spirochaetota bacterium]
MHIRNIIYHIIDFLFPSYCVNCKKLISYKEMCLCNGCLQKIDYLKNTCEICSGDIIENKCTICSSRKLFIDKNIAVAAYAGVIKEILHNYKFNKRRRLYKHISLLSLNHIIRYKELIDAVTSVPINRKKRWERGFNQSELIARDISRKLGKKYRSILKEKYHFKTQKKLGYRERFLNILDRYYIKNAGLVAGKTILIIDDVFTTGATINECARILKSFGADRVYSLTIAKADIKRVDNFLF